MQPVMTRSRPTRSAQDKVGGHAARARPDSAAARLEAVAAGLPQDEITLGEFLDRLGEEGLGLTLLILSVAALIPSPGLPIGAIFGAALALVSVQILTGAGKLRVPRWLAGRTLRRSHVVALVNWAVPWLRRAERLLRPRLPALIGRHMRLALAFPILVLGLTIALPIPLANALPALALIAFALGILMRDGLAVLAGTALSVAALVWTAVVLVSGAHLLDWLADTLGIR